MLRRVTQWMRGETKGSDPLGRTAVRGHSEPSYPPPDAGVPAVSVDALLESERERVARVAHNTKLTPDEFESLMVPVIRRFIGYVHLLPASKGHHHRGQGGLLAHSLEVAFFSSQAASAKIFGFGETSVRKKREIPRWHVAATLVGLLHDIGKPISDMEVRIAGGAAWNPFTAPLTDWLAANKAERYYTSWRSNRHLRHKKIATTIIPEIITPEMKAWLCVDDASILQSILEALSDSGEERVLSEMMVRADEASVARDMKRQPGIPDQEEDSSPEVADLLYDAMQTLWESNAWGANQSGARVWSGDSGTFIVWKRAATEIAEHLDGKKIHKFPRDVEVMAEMLVSAGIAALNVDEQGKESPYWLISTDYFDHSRRPTYLYSIKLEDPQSLLGELPEPVTITVKGEESKAGPAGDESDREIAKPSTEAIEKRGIAPASSNAVDDHSPQDQAQAFAEDTEEAKALGLPHPSEVDMPPDADEDEVVVDVELPASLRTTVKPRRAPSQDDAVTAVEERSAHDLTETGRIGSVLAEIADQVRGDPKARPHYFAVIGEEHYLRFPGPLASHGRPREIADEAAGEGWIVARSDKPKTSPAHDLDDGDRGLLLSKDLLERFERAVRGGVDEERGSENPSSIAGTSAAQRIDAEEVMPQGPEGKPSDWSGDEEPTPANEQARALEVAESIRRALIHKDDRFYHKIQVEQRGHAVVFRKLVMGLFCNNLGFTQAEFIRAIETAPFMRLIDGGKVEVDLTDG